MIHASWVKCTCTLTYHLYSLRLAPTMSCIFSSNWLIWSSREERQQWDSTYPSLPVICVGSLQQYFPLDIPALQWHSVSADGSCPGPMVGNQMGVYWLDPNPTAMQVWYYKFCIPVHTALAVKFCPESSIVNSGPRLDKIMGYVRLPTPPPPPPPPPHTHCLSHLKEWRF